MLRLLVLLVLLFAHPVSDDHMNDSAMDPGGLRFLLRDADGQGVAGAALRVRTAAGAERVFATNAAGVVESGPLDEAVVWLMGARLADGTELRADSVPVSAGFRLPLLPGQTYDVLLRIDGPYLVLDPAQALAGEDGLPTGPTPEALATPPATLAPVVAVQPTLAARATADVGPSTSATAAAATAVPQGQQDVAAPSAGTSSAGWWLLGLLGLALVGLAVWWRRGRRRAA